jgi:hypothetical protein
MSGVRCCSLQSSLVEAFAQRCSPNPKGTRWTPVGGGLRGMVRREGFCERLVVSDKRSRPLGVRLVGASSSRLLRHGR